MDFFEGDQAPSAMTGITSNSRESRPRFGAEIATRISHERARDHRQITVRKSLPVFPAISSL